MSINYLLLHMAETSNEVQIADWLSRQLGRLVEHDAGRVPHNPAEYLEKQDRRMKLLSRICVAQEALSNTQATLAAQRWRHTELLSRLGRARFELEARRKQFITMVDHPDEVKIRPDMVIMPDPWDSELISARTAFLQEDEQQLLSELLAFKQTLEEDSTVRFEERTLRERADAHRRNAQRARLRQIETGKTAPLEAYCSLRYRKTELQKLTQVSEASLKSMTANGLAKMHHLSDFLRQKHHQREKKTSQKKVDDAFALEEARLQEKSEILERRIAILKGHTKQIADELLRQREKHAAEEAEAVALKNGDEKVKKCKSDIKGISSKVREVERTLDVVRARVKEERVALREAVTISRE